jgi:hypothetical protein
MEHIQMLVSVHFKNISALTPDTSLPLSQAICLSLSLLLLHSVVLITQPLFTAAVVAFCLLPFVRTTCQIGSQDTS